MSSTDKYIQVILNWLVFYHQLCPDRSSIYFLCLDKTTEIVMTKYGLQCSHVFHTANNNNKLWLVRVRLTKQLLDQGFDVLLSDSDALWLRNPFEYLENFDGSDIISSRASFPEDVFKKYGATLCMGFIYIKTNEKTRALWGELSNTMAKDPRPDDQRSLNKILMSKGLRYPAHLEYLNSSEGDTGVMPYMANQSKVRVTLLPHRQFRRQCEGYRLSEIHESVVAHCLLDKTGSAKEKGSKRYKLWVLRENWDRDFFSPNETNGKTADNFLNEISEQQRKLFSAKRMKDQIARADTENIVKSNTLNGLFNPYDTQFWTPNRVSRFEVFVAYS